MSTQPPTRPAMVFGPFEVDVTGLN